MLKKCTENKNWQEAKRRSEETHRKLKIERIKKYNENPKKCLYCGKKIEYCVGLKIKKFCNTSCSASFNSIGNTNNKGKFKNKRDFFNCLNCGKKLTTNQKKYCSYKCDGEYTHKKHINIFLENQKDIKILPDGIRLYLLSKANNKCEKCGWGEKNTYSNTYPLIVDHIDGNSENNQIKNLQVICSNCDSILPTYKALNKGNGRHNRRVRYKVGKSY